MMSVQKLIINGTIEKIKNGYYRLVETQNAKSEAARIAMLFPDGILCMNTALFYYVCSNRTLLYTFSQYGLGDTQYIMMINEVLLNQSR